MLDKKLSTSLYFVTCSKHLLFTLMNNDFSASNEVLWESVLAEIQMEVSKGTYITYFRQTHLDSLVGNVATVSVPTFIIADQIEKKYSALIKTILDKKTGQNCSVVFSFSRKKPEDSVKKEAEGTLFAPKPEVKPRSLLRVKTEYQFETLAVSDSNQLAYTAALAVAKDPGKKYNPLFLYGSVGVGKTHLMHSIANKVVANNPHAKILYLTTEEFTNEVVEAILEKNTSSLRRKFRQTDLLLLDDIQFLTGKDKVQEELFHTFNVLIDNGGQIVFSSDRPPSELKKIEARLASRFEGGLTVDIQPPDFEMRCAILLIKSKKYDVLLSTEGAKLVADKIEDTRALEGFLLRLSSFQLASNKQEASEADISTLLGKPKEKSRFLHPDTVIDVVCEFYNIKSTQLKGSKRDAIFVKPRHVCMYLLKEEVKLPLAEIGNLLGGRDHTTIMHGIEKIRSLLETQERIQEELSFLRGKMLESN